MTASPPLPEVTIRPALEIDGARFGVYFQDYLAELAALSGARPDRNGHYGYDQYDLYWHDPARAAFFVEYGGSPAGLLLLRELTDDEMPPGGRSLQVAEICVFRGYRRRGVGKRVMRLAARTAEERGLPLTWSAYMNNGPANALYSSVLGEFSARDGAWLTERTRGIDSSGLARFYYRMVPPRCLQDPRIPHTC